MRPRSLVWSTPHALINKFRQELSADPLAGPLKGPRVIFFLFLYYVGEHARPVLTQNVYVVFVLLIITLLYYDLGCIFEICFKAAGLGVLEFMSYLRLRVSDLTQLKLLTAFSFSLFFDSSHGFKSHFCSCRHLTTTDSSVA